jgi:hypothetical protein
VIQTLTEVDAIDAVSGLLRRPHTQASVIRFGRNLAPQWNFGVCNPEDFPDCAQLLSSPNRECCLYTEFCDR